METTRVFDEIARAYRDGLRGVDSRGGTRSTKTYSTQPIEFNYNEDIVDVTTQEFGILTAGTLASRPSSVEKGFVYYATDINKPIWYNGGGVWVDATGATV